MLFCTIVGTSSSKVVGPTWPFLQPYQSVPWHFLHSLMRRSWY